MTTTLANCEILLSTQLKDYWAGTTTSAGAAGGTTVIDTALSAKANDWIDSNKDMYDQITSGTCDGEERKISSLANSTGTLTTLAHTAQIASAVTYRVHRLFTASEKRIALIASAKNIFPGCFNEVWDESLVSGNCLKDGSFERWTTSTNLADWTENTTTVTQTSTAGYFKNGSYSARLNTAAGSLSQSNSNFDDIKYLAGHSVTFSVQGWSDTASCLRLGISDGTTTTYSDYHDGDSKWTDINDPLEVTADIDENAVTITFYIYHSVAAGTSYVDDARVMGGDANRVYIGHLGLAKNKPHRVEYELGDYSRLEPWMPVRDIKIDSSGYLSLPSWVPTNVRLRIRGIGYLDFLASGVVSTAWTATITLDAPQTEILVAGAALYLYTTMVMPNFTQGTAKAFQEMMGFWTQELATRSAKFGMNPPPILANWGTR